ncbi:hypothetical protein TBLA_0I02470 [Henningerozyma blattae CBS 6284]|uniref:PPM-type phosphatase domain-containing protein n=1 Tax=Henningerozyma blattae (strain ATCC 34711 / CBS 6284 / DSM 70876 / NBRC 10599 / NRRL Y-10934 / UCD 77-7) TaxID=1071380 RepID=I2H953_HENB6|nr:hypothetical protein TBLA_0I02470 [Tetrapisispora blattae CBS 6284]CCH62905.1 hypothetical protein TBLA_0I02470 [Tetrapisispora blattae CBS 6284]
MNSVTSVTRPYLLLRPAIFQNQTLQKVSAGAKKETAVNNSKKVNSNMLLKLNLKKFPNLLGHSTSRINRLYNEDAYSCNIISFPSLQQDVDIMRTGKSKNNDIFKNNRILNLSVFDGHGGEGRVSKLLAEKLHLRLSTELPTKKKFFDLLKEYKDIVGGEYWEVLYKNRFKFYDKYIKHCNTKIDLVLFADKGKEKNSNSTWAESPIGSRMIFDKYGNIIDKTSLLTEYQRLRFYYTYLKFDLEECCGHKRHGSVTNINQNIYDQFEQFPGGSTATSIFLTPFDIQSNRSVIHDDSFIVRPTSLLKLVVTQIGDSKAIICDSNGIAHSLSKPHNASSEREIKRLYKQPEKRKNLSIAKMKTAPIIEPEVETDSFGDKRFLDTFANTRSFGDIIAKNKGLSAEPELYSYLIGPTIDLPHSEKSKLQFGGDECFIILISDGVYNVIPDQELVDLITSTVNNRGLKTATPQYITDEIIKYVYAIGGRDADNATCVLLRLPNWGNWPSIDRTGKIREEKLMHTFSGDRNMS